jgi:C4-dicarboxylate-specific signal transduction histidine kinase
VTDFQLLMLSLAVIGLLTGAVVSERERAEQATREFERRLRESQGELEHVSRLSALGEMASTLAHELNQPMTATRAYVRVAQRMLADEAASGQRGGRSRAMDAIASAISQVDLAGAIVRNLRDMVRRRTITREPVDLGELAHQSLTLVRSQAQFTQIRVSIRKRPDVPAVLAERIRIQQVIMNLLRNAIDAVRAAPVERREVTIDIAPAAPGQVEVAIRDRGPGVSPDVRENLFAAFTTTKPEGLGLGLSICRSIVQAHGGRMWLESTGPEGSDFRFTLPVAGDMIRS